MSTVFLHSLRAAACATALAGFASPSGAQFRAPSPDAPVEWKQRVAPLRVNFQSEGAPVPFGYVRDFGESFGPRTGVDQGDGLVYGWVAPGTTTPLDMVGEGRDREELADQRLDTLMHMDRPSGSAPGPGAWELEVDAGTYEVVLVVGDPSYTNSLHLLDVEGVSALAGFAPDNGLLHGEARVVVSVADGRLTIDSTGGDNTKLAYLVVTPASSTRPMVASVSPTQLEAGVATDGFVSTSLHLPQASIDTGTVDATTVMLYPTHDPAQAVQVVVNTSGGGDTLVLDPIGALDAWTEYTFEVSSGVADLLGHPIVPFTSVFTTGEGIVDPGGPEVAIEFERIELVTGTRFTSVAIGPGGRLWALARDGLIHRFDIELDGTLANETVLDGLQLAEGGTRLAIGLVHDPASTPAQPIVWVSHTTFGFSDMPDWGGAISRLSGPTLSTVERVVTGLPRSSRDHVTNGLAFGPDGALYFVQGSNSAMGAPDTAWADRPERALSAAVLRLDTSVALAQAPLDVRTEEGGVYDPFAPGAPLTLFATGVRNAYDLAWHSNGSLYVPTNGSAAGGNTPTSPLPLPLSCDQRIDGVYSGPAVTGIESVNHTQADFLFRVESGGYYGHPNPARCEWVMNGGNPTAGQDPAEVSDYPVGVAPDPNWRGFAFDFENNKSPNGVVEYRGEGFGCGLLGALLVARYSGGDDLVALVPGSTGDIAYAIDDIAAFDDLVDPLDLVEAPGTGNLYVSEYGGERLTLLRALDGDVQGASATPGELIFSGVQGDLSPAQDVVVVESGGSDLEVQSIVLAGQDPGAFALDAGPIVFPWTMPAGTQASVRLHFAPPSGATGPLAAELRMVTDRGEIRVGLHGLSAQGLEGSNEPPLAQVVSVLGHAIDVGGTSLSLGTGAAPIGDEVAVPLFVRAAPGDVSITPVARYSPSFELPFGYYVPNGGSPAHVEVGVLSGVSTPPQHQMLFPSLASGTTGFDPGGQAFGLYTSSPSHEAYTEDALNASLFPSNVAHAARVYPLRDRYGKAVPNAYLVGFEEASNGDYQDYVFVLENVVPAP